MSIVVPPAPAPTMHEIAERAGVGKATVSLALRDDPRLRPETRRRIQRIAAKMGYRTNATVANLMAQLRASGSPKFHATLGLLNASPDPAALAGPRTAREWVTGCQDRAAQLGYGLDLFWLHEPGVSPARLATILKSRDIRGLVISPLIDRSSLPDRFDLIWQQWPCVVAALRPAWPPLNFSTNDQFSTAFRAVQRLYEYGYRRMGLAVSPDLDATVDLRYSAGFWAGQEASQGGSVSRFFHSTLRVRPSSANGTNYTAPMRSSACTKRSGNGSRRWASTCPGKSGSPIWTVTTSFPTGPGCIRTAFW